MLYGHTPNVLLCVFICLFVCSLLLRYSVFQFQNLGPQTSCSDSELLVVFLSLSRQVIPSNRQGNLLSFVFKQTIHYNPLSTRHVTHSVERCRRKIPESLARCPELYRCTPIVLLRNLTSFMNDMGTHEQHRGIKLQNTVPEKMITTVPNSLRWTDGLELAFAGLDISNSF